MYLDLFKPKFNPLLNTDYSLISPDISLIVDKKLGDFDEMDPNTHMKTLFEKNRMSTIVKRDRLLNFGIITPKPDVRRSFDVDNRPLSSFAKHRK